MANESTPVKQSGFVVTYHGDESVGIRGARWRLTGDFHFDSQADVDLFKQKIAEAFELCSDTPIFVETLEDAIQRVAEEAKVLYKEVFPYHNH